MIFSYHILQGVFLNIWFHSYFCQAKDLSFDFTNILWVFVFITLQFLFVKFVSRQSSSIWEAHLILSEGFLSSCCSLLQMPLALCCLCCFLVSFLLTFSNLLFHSSGELAQPRICTPRLGSGRVPGDGTELPLPEDPLTAPQWSHMALPIPSSSPSHLPAKEPLLAHVNLTVLRVTEKWSFSHQSSSCMAHRPQTVLLERPALNLHINSAVF